MGVVGLLVACGGALPWLVSGSLPGRWPTGLSVADWRLDNCPGRCGSALQWWCHTAGSVPSASSHHPVWGGRQGPGTLPGHLS